MGAGDIACLKESPPSWDDFVRTLRLTLLGRPAGHKRVPLPDTDSGWQVIARSWGCGVRVRLSLWGTDQLSKPISAARRCPTRSISGGC